MSMDAKKLKEAIEWAKSAYALDTKTFILAEAAEAHLATLPRTREVKVWHVEWCHRHEPKISVWFCREAADMEADKMGGHPCNKGDWTNIRITGPHIHVVPA
jgi:hypothetical protein